MKIRYSYTKYTNCPKATEISKSRAQASTFYSMALGFISFFSVLTLLVDFLSCWYISIPLLALCVLGFWYLFTRYDNVTQRLVDEAIEEHKQAIEKQNQARQKIITDAYRCSYIYCLHNYKCGRCEKCSASSPNLRECLIGDKNGGGSKFLCNSCITRYNQNKV